MNIFKDIITMLLTHQGAHLSCLFALLIFRRPLRLDQICRATRCSESEVLYSLHLLHALGVITLLSNGRWICSQYYRPQDYRMNSIYFSRN